MTLILSLITQQFVIHVSDRRLTDARTGDPFPSAASKTVVAPVPQFVASYTGIAVLEGKATDTWLASTLWDARETDDTGAYLSDAATKAIARVRLPARLKRHTFVLSGWVGTGEFEPLEPTPLLEGVTADVYTMLVTNCFEASGPLGDLVELPEAQPKFISIGRALFPNEKYLLLSAGVPLTVTEARELDANVAAALRSSSGRERAAAVAMAATTSRVAARTDLVGGGVFICSIPRGYAPQADAPGFNVLGVHWGLPEQDRATFVHAPDSPSTVVESPTILQDPWAARATLTVHKGYIPDLAGAGEVPEEAEIKLELLALRSSDEIARLGGALE
jgi:hypothetical protein